MTVAVVIVLMHSYYSSTLETIVEVVVVTGAMVVAAVGSGGPKTTRAQELFTGQGSTPSPRDILETCKPPQLLAKVFSTSSVPRASFEEHGVHQQSKPLLFNKD